MPKILLAATFVLAAAQASATERYFPEGSLADTRDMDESHNETFAKAFRELDEPSLLTLVEKGATKGKRIYRFTWLRSFDRPICITLMADDRVTLIAKTLNGKGREAKKLTVNKPVTISHADFEEFLRLLDDADYSKMIATESNADNHWCWSTTDRTWSRSYHSGKDGATWTLESCADECYSFAERWSPQSKSPFRKACLFMVKLGGLENEKVY